MVDRSSEGWLNCSALPLSACWNRLFSIMENPYNKQQATTKHHAKHTHHTMHSNLFRLVVDGDEKNRRSARARQTKSHEPTARQANRVCLLYDKQTLACKNRSRSKQDTALRIGRQHPNAAHDDRPALITSRAELGRRKEECRRCAAPTPTENAL